MYSHKDGGVLRWDHPFKKEKYKMVTEANTIETAQVGTFARNIGNRKGAAQSRSPHNCHKH